MLAGEGRGEGFSTSGQSLCGESPHPALRADLPRKRRAIAYGSDLARGHPSRRPPLAGPQDEDQVRGTSLNEHRCCLASS
ncbi:hypothetical protein C7U89_31215 [Bradyrhizobium sp. WBOS4]|nr:hypothetical protein [Bradyrhizobium sp. WBOS8]MDD1587376.1 hypothetical protein [Bradyrhizobium sp. WBOS4]UUO45478.1 hypothetical protein DCM78_00050 [Bradyrhizobium sp. WBOS04]UUO58397.1 hypothetical protein DCM80_03900 [Bradyrhizobium sp. WBOS08]